MKKIFNHATFQSLWQSDLSFAEMHLSFRRPSGSLILLQHIINSLTILHSGLEILLLYEKKVLWIFYFAGNTVLGNKMDSLNLATLFAPNLMHSFNDDPTKGSQMTSASERMDHVSALKLLIERRIWSWWSNHFIYGNRSSWRGHFVKGIFQRFARTCTSKRSSICTFSNTKYVWVSLGKNEIIVQLFSTIFFGLFESHTLSKLPQMIPKILKSCDHMYFSFKHRTKSFPKEVECFSKSFLRYNVESPPTISAQIGQFVWSDIDQPSKRTLQNISSVWNWFSSNAWKRPSNGQNPLNF